MERHKVLLGILHENRGSMERFDLAVEWAKRTQSPSDKGYTEINEAQKSGVVVLDGNGSNVFVFIKRA